MGQLCCGGRIKAAGAVTETGRPERSLEKLVKQERGMVRRTILHLKNVVPSLLRYVYNDKEACKQDKSDLIPIVLSTIRQVLVSYSKVYSGDSKWFKLALSHKESSMLIHCYLQDYSTELLSRVTFPEDGEREFAGMFVHEFEELWKKMEDTDSTDAKGMLKAIYWKDTAMLVSFFMQADEDAGGDLSVSEIEGVMHKQNIALEGSRLRKLIQVQDVSGDMRLDFGEYIAFFIKITEKRFIEQALFSEYVSSEPKRIMKPDEFHHFMTTQQGFKGDKRASLKILNRLKDSGMATVFEIPGGDGKQEVGLSPKHFAQYLTSFPLSYDEEKQCEVMKIPHNSCYDAKYTTKIYQDMKRPMTEYLIASSHNTYLDHGQLTGQSSCNAYKNALLLGCRCVEIDCWDGPDGEPIVYHGHTLTTKVKFIDVIKTIDKYAFKRTQYPVILSLEVHTSPAQQSRMGQIMKQIFRRKLDNGDFVSILQPPIAFTDHSANSPDFTPDGLRGKILVKGKIVSADDQAKFREHCELVAKMLESRTLHLDTTRGADDESDHEEEDKNNLDSKGSQVDLKKVNSLDLTQTITAMGENACSAKNAPAPTSSSSKKKEIKISAELSSCVWMKSVHFRGYELSKKKGNHWDVSSFTENTYEKLCGSAKLREEFAECNKILFARIYPGAHRVNSDNYHPQYWWNVGAQIVALNYQIEHNKSEELRYNLAKFTDNGRCGYLLKPNALRLDHRKLVDVNDGIKVTVEIFQGFSLPKPNNESSGEKIDPYVYIYMNGHESDVSRKYSTKVIDDNGWNPEWFDLNTRPGDRGLEMKDVKQSTANTNGGNLFIFNVKCLDMAMLTLQVWDQDVGVEDDFIGEAVIPVNMLKEGYRTVPLKSDKFVQLNSMLFCKFTIDVPKRYA